MANAKIYSFANPPEVDASQIQVPQNVRVVVIQNEEEQNNLKTQEINRNGMGTANDKVIAQGTATAYIIIVDTKIGDESTDFPISYGGIKPQNREAVDVASYSVYKFNLDNTQVVQAGKIPLDLTAAGVLQELDISNPDNPCVTPIS